MRLAATLFVCRGDVRADSSDLVRELRWDGRRQRSSKIAPGCQRFMADDLQYAHAGGQLQTKEQTSRGDEGPARYESFTFAT